MKLTQDRAIAGTAERIGSGRNVRVLPELPVSTVAASTKTPPLPGLAARNAPPLGLPGTHFASALIFWLLGAGGLIWIAPDLARGSFPLPRVAAVTHLFTLGWITTTIQGALYQFLPVALQVPIRWPRLAYLTLALYAPGLLVFIGGLMRPDPTALFTGAVLFGTGLLLFIVNLGVTLKRAPERNLTWWALAGASVFLLATVILGIALAGNLRWDYMGPNRFLAMGVHIHVAVVGWVMLVMVGVAHRLLPMFLLSHGATERFGAAAVWMLASGVTLLLALHHGLNTFTTWTVAALIAGGVASFVAQAALYFRHRKKPALDPGLRLAATALAFLVVALVIAPFFIAQGISAPRVAVAYVTTLLLGGISLFVAGHYYKIVPFLVWYHRFGPLVGKRPVPRVAELYSARLGNLALVLLAAGVVGLVVVTIIGAASVARVPASIFAVGAGILAIQMIQIGLRRP
jgi:hypothetical protein